MTNMTNKTNKVIPHLCIQGAASAIEFYEKAFGAREVYRLADPADGRLGHAEIEIGGSRLMLADEYPDHGALSPRTLGGSPVTLHLQVDDVEAVAERAVAAGARLVRPVADQFYGERTARLEDPFGHVWHLAQTTEEVSPEEMQRRYNAMGSSS
jgi:PhnB protein